MVVGYTQACYDSQTNTLTLDSSGYIQSQTRTSSAETRETPDEGLPTKGSFLERRALPTPMVRVTLRNHDPQPQTLKVSSCGQRKPSVYSEKLAFCSSPSSPSWWFVLITLVRLALLAHPDTNIGESYTSCRIKPRMAPCQCSHESYCCR